MGRRKRCSGCEELTDPGELARVGGRDWLCPECLVKAALELAPPPLPEDEQERVEAQYGEAMPARDAPEPLALPDEDARFDGLIEYEVEGWPLRKGRLSASALATYLRCAEQFRRQYVLGERRPSGGKAIAGTAAHATVEAAVAHHLAGRGRATLPQVIETYHATFDRAVAKESDGAGIEWGKSNKVELDEDSTRSLGHDAMTAYYGSPSYDRLLEAEALEHTFAILVPGVPVPICGLLDVLTPRSTVDLKFGDKCVSVIDPGWRIQSRVYGLASRRSSDFHSVSFAGKIADPSSAPGLRAPWDAVEAILAANTVRMVVAEILSAAERYGPDTPWPGNLTHTWACNACDFRPECAWWNVSTSDLLL